jgi:hypothetical protein
VDGFAAVVTAHQVLRFVLAGLDLSTRSLGVGGDLLEHRADGLAAVAVPADSIT